ncbi:unnamed protein product [Parascedosporium putredinis]|uniref:Amino acid permease/ SLC12A domain-containing protein n=1 Tax=Parascedosporium putredinis TaxID=1442378 RepID=A0A9P1GVA9_9PEZI|nr:unnamed protein product [Parascedosporium putredinis]CAI7988020.1 unnamed protein product [Parascedosporium putredinis]
MTDITNKHPAVETASDDDSSSDFRAIDPHSGVKRGLKTRHLSMMALAGIIGPGLLIGSGGALANGGPASLLIGFGVIGIIAFSIMQSLGELTTLYPSGGAFTGLADRFVDKAFGVAVGWNYYIIWFCVLANEYNVISSIFTFWGPQVPVWGYFLIFWFAFLAFQLLGVETFGEAEFWLALVKLLGLTAFFIFALTYVTGGIKGVDALGTLYWREPGPWVSGFRGVLWRIIFIYMGSALFFGLTCPSDAPDLVSGSSRAIKSPMTVAIQNAGWEGGVHLINAFIFVTCLSAINSSIYIGSRTILFMAQDGKAPRFLGWTNKRGVPIPAIVFTNLFGALSMMNVSTGAGKAYGYIVNLSGVSTFLVWGAISFTHIRFRRAWIAQGHSVDELPFKALWYPWNAYFGLGANIFLAIVQGWSTLSPFDAGNFVDAYILLPLFGVIYFGYKFIFKTKYWNLHEIDLQTGRRRDLDEGKRSHDENQEAASLPFWKKLWRNF